MVSTAFSRNDRRIPSGSMPIAVQSPERNPKPMTTCQIYRRDFFPITLHPVVFPLRTVTSNPITNIPTTAREHPRKIWRSDTHLTKTPVRSPVLPG
jgi:hypothetical protein